MIDCVYFKGMMVPLFQQTTKSVSNSHLQAAEGALGYWNNRNSASLVVDNHAVLIPILFPSFFRVSPEYRNQITVALVGKVLKNAMKTNSSLFNELLKNYKAERQRDRERGKERED